MASKAQKSEIVHYSMFYEKPYTNSDQQRFGVTLRGKGKEFVNAHGTFKDLLIKGKEYDFENHSLRILDVVVKTGMTINVIEVTDRVEKSKGNAEMKIYTPSSKKNKGATIELRKITGFDYSFVDSLKNITVNILEGLVAGTDVKDVLKKGKSKFPSKSKVTSKPALFDCDQCVFQSRFSSDLKVHQANIHGLKSFECSNCNFKSESESQLKEHNNEKHLINNKRTNEATSPRSYPPSKKREH